MTDEVTRDELATVLGVDVRSIGNFALEGMPKLARGRFSLARCVPWYVDREREKARDGMRRAAARTPDDLEAARARKMTADATLAEIEVEKAQGLLVPVETVAAVVTDVSDRLRAILVNLPDNHGLKLEALGVSAKDAEAVLAAIAEELTAALRTVADDLDDEADRSDAGVD